MFGGCFKLNAPLSNAMSVVELRVHMDCEGCEKRIRKAISKLHGVDSLDIDMEKQKVTVSGYVDKRKVLKVVRRIGRKAEFWAFPYDSEYQPYAATYLDESTFTSSYNYLMHGYNEASHGYFPQLPYSTIDHHITYRFSDDNVHACSIM
ncbi:heavy metal-associated isoprenylated plant protein 45-like [Salvia miltiorrhiza]|uniref:heavy metal-associated isoprenylated plant protein 45-like n=1 Tax=Salvia miltiorrhiza TaxID=226208 RepID=UPI0025AC2459|nr:heavy metal-associated isoprenylated plant protein 45-like [Salvia miltiorrhiza]XP_057786832.1 heavy metal-associated isoprenylated plant protein 45-like [Salvia miltiorrhiza]